MSQYMGYLVSKQNGSNCIGSDMNVSILKLNIYLRKYLLIIIIGEQNSFSYWLSITVIFQFSYIVQYDNLTRYTGHVVQRFFVVTQDLFLLPYGPILTAVYMGKL